MFEIYNLIKAAPDLLKRTDRITMDENATEMQWYMAVDNSAASQHNEYEVLDMKNVLKQPGIGADSSLSKLNHLKLREVIS